MFQLRWVTDGNGKMQLQYRAAYHVAGPMTTNSKNWIWSDWQVVPIVQDERQILPDRDENMTEVRSNGTRGYVSTGRFGK